MRISKVYTRTGDEGQTSLGSGERVSKASPRVSAYGDVDELNSFLGLARTKIANPDLLKLLERIQNELFILGADLAVPQPDLSPSGGDRQRRVSPAEIENLEQTIDRYNETLPPLQEFILPAGNEAGAILHVARAVARRAERRVVSLAQTERLNPLVLVYLNRLSDLLFVLARVANRQSGSGEVFAEFH
ncbi:MAG: cob(I)yrinic acid a,c-diamide adenosyltransferase [Terriglobia bacterium]